MSVPLFPDARSPSGSPASPDLTVVVPVFNEEECIAAVLDELCTVLGTMADRTWEIVAIDDGSTDRTSALLGAAARREPRIRVLRLTPNAGQSAAFWAGFQAARGAVIATIDADGQNDPADIPRCVEGLADADACCGYRQKRRDTAAKRWGSKLANRVRNRILGETVVDTGCSMKAFRAPFLKSLQYWDGMHRFLPTLAAMQGARIAQLPVAHRARSAGTSKYTNWGRLKRTVRDLQGVRWLKSRMRRFAVAEVATEKE
jgi:glycosyltransferase involved in cell wall biosynthesis